MYAIRSYYVMMGGEIGPTGDPLPKPDVLLLSYTGCFTFMKWFELIRHKYRNNFV